MQSTAPPSLTAKEAAKLLGVKPQTLYAYASRGLLRRVGDGKRRRYLSEDLERLRTRQRARSGHGAVAAAALSFGDPVLDSSITAIDERGPLYRGRPAVELAQAGVSFESVAELLWSGELPSESPAWRPFQGPARAWGPARTSLEDLLLALPALVQLAPERHSRARENELSLARQLIRSIALLLVPRAARRESGSIAELLSGAAKAPRKAAQRALDVALVLLADHELNASSFAARVAASTDAHLLACVMAALATLSGPRHGGACDRVEALLDEAATLPRPLDVIEKRARRGDAMTGFGHPLYRAGDPRAALLLEEARTLSRRNAGLGKRLGPLFALAQAMQRQGLAATVDFGLVALTRALEMPPGSAALLFALGRSAGWVAHVLEQRASVAVLRPRARYLGT
ncbi:MAG TPA: citrate synthase family protein [Polyangiaceae bacterium]|nr:citrate synthase family protein [Polyangiaceae bacterium]